jgi:hypothetical protein
MKKNIPNEVKALAEDLFCEEPEYIGSIDGSEVYCEHQSDNDPAPTGLPTLILWNGNKAKVVSGTDSLHLLSRL